MWDTICGPAYDTEKAICRRKFNYEQQDELGIASVISFIRR